MCASFDAVLIIDYHLNWSISREKRGRKKRENDGDVVPLIPLFAAVSSVQSLHPRTHHISAFQEHPYRPSKE
jgi:hypothetical protein